MLKNLKAELTPAKQELDSMILQALPCSIKFLLEREDIPEAQIIQAVSRLKFRGKIRQKGGCLEAIQE